MLRFVDFFCGAVTFYTLCLYIHFHCLVGPSDKYTIRLYVYNMVWIALWLFTFNHFLCNFSICVFDKTTHCVFFAGHNTLSLTCKQMPQHAREQDIRKLTNLCCDIMACTNPMMNSIFRGPLENIFMKFQCPMKKSSFNQCMTVTCHFSFQFPDRFFLSNK